MTDFVNRQAELALLDEMQQEPGAQLVMVYGRRRVGKTTLITHWAAQSGLPFLYWVAKQDPRELLIANLAQTIYTWQHGANAELQIFSRDWEAIFRMLAQAIGDRRAIVILDELPYVLQQDAGFASHLQAAWDHLFKDSQVLLFLSGSHIGMLTELTKYRAPLYGRLTAQFPLYPLAYGQTHHFLPRYDVYKRLAVYAILGGIPAYLERWRDQESIQANVQRLFLHRTGWFRHEPMVLISDLTRRETVNYEAILKVIAQGYHQRDEIATNSAIPTTHLTPYLSRLLELQFIERRIPATIPIAQMKTSRQARYHLRDPFLRFYYRFIDPNVHLIDGGLATHLWHTIEAQLRPFVATLFEALCREWVLKQAQQNKLPFAPENIGSHWSATSQVDVMAISWPDKQLLLGECKWSDQAVDRSVIAELIEGKTAKVLATLPDKGEGWQVHYAFFARHSFTPMAIALAQEHQARLLTLTQLEPDLL